MTIPSAHQNIYQDNLVLVVQKGPTLVGTEYENVAVIAKGRYQDDSIALDVVACYDSGKGLTPNLDEVIAHLTVNIGYNGGFDTIAVKDYSENAGIAAWLESQSTPVQVNSTDTRMMPWVERIDEVPTAFVSIPVYKAQEGTPLFSLLRAASEVKGDR